MSTYFFIVIQSSIVAVAGGYFGFVLDFGREDYMVSSSIKKSLDSAFSFVKHNLESSWYIAISLAYVRINLPNVQDLFKPHSKV